MTLRTTLLLLTLATIPSFSVSAKSVPDWETKHLHRDFYTEGAGFGDIDGDGSGDLVAGPFWFKGPAFEEKFEYYAPKVFDIRAYSDNFFSFVHDINEDGLNDIVVYDFPGKNGRVYLNPGNPARSSRWSVHRIADDISNESPHWIDLIPGGLPEIVCVRGTQFGYYQAGENPIDPWVWNAISSEGESAKFDHGLGVGDMDGDGRLDLISKQHWWKQPSGQTSVAPIRASGNRKRIKRTRTKADVDWIKNTWKTETYRGGAQIVLHDVDGDGDNDIITSLNGHGYGLAWYEKTSSGTLDNFFEKNRS